MSDLGAPSNAPCLSQRCARRQRARRIGRALQSPSKVGWVYITAVGVGYRSALVVPDRCWCAGLVPVEATQLHMTNIHHNRDRSIPKAA